MNHEPFKISKIVVHPECMYELLKEENGSIMYKGKQVFIVRPWIKTVGTMDYDKAKENKYYVDAKNIHNRIYNHPEQFSKYIEITTNNPVSELV